MLTSDLGEQPNESEGVVGVYRWFCVVLSLEWTMTRIIFFLVCGESAHGWPILVVSVPLSLAGLALLRLAIRGRKAGAGDRSRRPRKSTVDLTHFRFFSRHVAMRPAWSTVAKFRQITPTFYVRARSTIRVQNQDL